MQELTLAVVGIDFPNGDGSNRRSEAMMTLPGEPVALIPEPKNKHDSNAIAVISPRGVQIGYLSAERAPYIGGRMSRGEDLEAIPLGTVVRDDAGVNAPWSWHIDPSTLEFAFVTTEVCDGLPSYVEDEIVTSDQFCPWSAKVVAVDGV